MNTLNKMKLSDTIRKIGCSEHIWTVTRIAVWKNSDREQYA